jgi:branched-chain amino acid transport system ATP-binding protein
MLQISDLHCYYGTAHILHGVDLTVGDGEVVALLGRNGMGKTSLVRSIVGMMPPVLGEGTVVWQGEDIARLPSYEIAKRGVGLVPQGRHIFGSLSLLENLTVAARPGGNGDGWTLERVYDFFPRLKDRLNSRGRNLSGGEQQMLAIGRALMTNPRLLVMDEPSEGLAPIVIGQIRERLEALKGADLSILLVEQNLGLALRLADRISILGENGRIVWEGFPSQLESDAQAKRLHLGV